MSELKQITIIEKETYLNYLVIFQTQNKQKWKRHRITTTMVMVY